MALSMKCFQCRDIFGIYYYVYICIESNAYLLITLKLYLHFD